MTREEAITQLELLLEYCEMMTSQYPVWRRDCEALQMLIAALHPISREQVEKAWRGEWKHYLPPLGAGDVQCRCTRCGRTPDVETPFCAWCGAPMTDQAVQMVMERLEAQYESVHNN